MRLLAMTRPTSISPETLIRLTRELPRQPLDERDAGPLAELFNAIQGDMSALVDSDLGETEPATIWSSVEGQP